MEKAIIIGGSSGIGRELVRILSRNGYVVGVMGRRIRLLEELGNETGAHVQEIDVADTESAMAILAKFIDEMGGVELMVISAGMGHLNAELDWSLEYDAIKTNVTGFAAMANVAVKHFIEKGYGHLVGISSLAGLRGGRQAPAYNASKAFESNYLEGLRQRVRKLELPITITDIKPGYVKTAMAKGERIFWAAEADKAAFQIFKAIIRKKSCVYVTRRWRFFAWLLKTIPGPIYERM
jgi:short-subunit dehydrogenase